VLVQHLGGRAHCQWPTCVARDLQLLRRGHPHLHRRRLKVRPGRGVAQLPRDSISGGVPCPNTVVAVSIELAAPRAGAVAPRYRQGRRAANGRVEAPLPRGCGERVGVLGAEEGQEEGKEGGKEGK
jgi:hypothetical protein